MRVGEAYPWRMIPRTLGPDGMTHVTGSDPFADEWIVDIYGHHRNGRRPACPA